MDSWGTQWFLLFFIRAICIRMRNTSCVWISMSPQDTWIMLQTHLKNVFFFRCFITFFNVFNSAAVKVCLHWYALIFHALHSPLQHSIENLFWEHREPTEVITTYSLYCFGVNYFSNAARNTARPQQRHGWRRLLTSKHGCKPSRI